MKKLKLLLLGILSGSILFLPFQALAFSYNGTNLGVSFSGNEIFSGTNLYPGANVCKDVTFVNLLSTEQPLSFTAQGFNSTAAISDFFNFFTLTIKDGATTYVDKKATAVSTNTNSPENITILAANASDSFNFCINIDSTMGNEFQGKSYPVDFSFGFVGQEITPPIPVITVSTPTSDTTTTVTAPSAVAGIQTAQPKAEAKGEVAGETNNQNMCCEWVWWNLIPWILVAILLIWLMWMWSKDRNRRDKENI